MSAIDRRWTAITTVLAIVTLLAVGVQPAANAHNEDAKDLTHPVPEIGLRVDAPEELHAFFPGAHWSGSGAVDNQSAKLVYAGTGCSPASYAPVADEIQGNIALIDNRVSATNPADQCPAALFFQKVQSAEQAGAIGLVQIEVEGGERGGGNAISGTIPAIELDGTAEAFAIRDAVIAGTAVIGTIAKPSNFPAMRDIPCTDGTAGPFPCDGIDLLSFTPQEEFDGAGVNDIWGWTDPETGDEYVILGKNNGVGFFRVTDPINPVYLGEVPNPSPVPQTWQDIKVHADHAFWVSESADHGMLVFDLTRLRDKSEPEVYEADATYELNDAAHNLVINENSGFAYLVGGNAGLVVPDQCLSGLHMVDISDPKSPSFTSCYALEGGPGTGFRTVGEPLLMEHAPTAYVHDAQCVIYDGPDERYTDREICVNASEDVIVVADVTDKVNPSTVGVLQYEGAVYSHQGWFTEDKRFWLANDELDEQTNEHNTRTIVVNLEDLENPTVQYMHLHDLPAIDHNNYVKGDRVFQSNYASGLRVLDVSNVETELTQVAFFDTYPNHDDATFDGTWSNYPYFASGTIAVSGRTEGLFLVRLQSQAPTPAPAPEPAPEPLPATGGGIALASLAVMSLGYGSGRVAQVDHAGRTRGLGLAPLTSTGSAPGRPRRRRQVASVEAPEVGSSTVSTATTRVSHSSGVTVATTYPRWTPSSQRMWSLFGYSPARNALCSSGLKPSEVTEVPTNSVATIGDSGSAASTGRSPTQLEWMSPVSTTVSVMPSLAR